MHPEAYAAVGRMIELSGINTQEPWRAIDVGGANWNGSARPHLPNAHWTVLDMAPAQYEVDDWHTYVVADATTWRTPQSSDRYDVVLCTELLEHVENWPAVIATLADLVTDDGIVLITCASTGRPMHGATGTPLPLNGEWYGNVDVPDLEVELMKHFKSFWTHFQPLPGDAYAMAKGPIR